MLEVYFESYGCSANYNSTEIMKGLVKQAGLNITSNIDFADLVVINSCIVKEPTEEKIRRKVQDLSHAGKKVILAGCMAKLRKKSFLNYDSVYLLGTNHIKDINNLIQEIVDGTYDTEKYLDNHSEVKVNVSKISDEKYIGINQISEGCLGTCTYCITRLAKGKLFSYPSEKIIESVKNDVMSGCKEIWITSQDNASYNSEMSKDISKDGLVQLLEEIIKIKGNFFVRVGMMNPNNVLKILPELIEIYKHEKMFKFLHIPVQSGSNKILKDMKRKYTREDVLKIVNEFKKEIPNIIFSTDVIVGYPGETKKDFEDTLDLVKQINPEILNRSKFWPRPQTPAEKLKPISKDEMNKRSLELANLHLQICKDNQKKWIGWVGKVLVDKKGFGNTYLARSPEYKLFAVQSKDKILGKIVKIKVKSVLPHYLLAIML
ncbi:MAG: RNA modification enzyme, MiaB family [archaeon GW2011_AR13]|nr:MAG: RNA modification enzyme, MiaB family [archaeon GW2011_AR13]HIG94796.1 tRNA (N(6)-L-threonylcarbamoyladenosine(37)-C(2))-methylthiotransferase [Nanoarchaeota archaeon]HIH63087.1 tRNA (N(6)-L-threonylcarbamoyladenosine(37)-C(2))-methylthiotransferase [Nanoarchaeota archaeon]HIJ09486.1 tRNA (N(6)-L-threonylcarbamoyladenosine(37)-C(2))-methylthiotransferase [Nanoarchaeota archaeon]